MFEILNNHKVKIHEQIVEIFSDLYASLNADTERYVHLIKDLEKFCLDGKGIRGGLLTLCVENISPQDLGNAYKIAAALEIMHASVLVHDDIIDRDVLRRNKPTLPALFKNYALKNNFFNPSQVGDSSALCIADIGFFLAFGSLSTSSLPVNISSKIISTIAHEFILVGIGEIGDIEITATKTTPTKEEVLTMYKYKTARYSFSLPFKLAGQLSKLPEASISKLVEYGELIGVIYQIKDDYLSLFGKQQEFGKKLGNDVIENKQTIYKIILFERLSDSDLNLANKIFGNKDCTEEDINFVTDLMKKYNVDSAVASMLDDNQKKLDIIRNSLNLPKPFISILNSLENELNNRTV